METLHELVHSIQIAAVEMGMDVSPKDVAFIISTFLEGLAHQGPEGANSYLQGMADDISRMRDE